MSRFELVFSLILAILIVFQLVYRIDFSDLYHPANKGGATGVMICLLGLFSLFLAHRAGSGQQDATSEKD
jgi:multisubunit Na+/H+ antiporter MnhG subunit